MKRSHIIILLITVHKGEQLAYAHVFIDPDLDDVKVGILSYTFFPIKRSTVML